MKKVKITIEITEQQNEDLHSLVMAMNRSKLVRDGFLQKKNVESLLEMLADDAAYVVRRPGSWEGSGMADLLQSHGYLQE